MKKIMTAGLVAVLSMGMTSCSNEESIEQVGSELTEAEIQENKEVIEKAESIEAELTTNDKELEAKEAELDELLNNL